MSARDPGGVGIGRRSPSRSAPVPEVLYLHPERVRLAGPWIDVDADLLPEMVLEVDHSTDVRPCKLGIYMESGFPEIWVLVPWKASRRAPGLAGRRRP